MQLTCNPKLLPPCNFSVRRCPISEEDVLRSNNRMANNPLRTEEDGSRPIPLLDSPLLLLLLRGNPGRELLEENIEDGLVFWTPSWLHCR